MKQFVEYSKAIGSLAFGLMVGVGIVMIAVPDFQERLPTMFAQTADQGDIIVTTALDSGFQGDYFSGSTVLFDIELTNTITSGIGEGYDDVTMAITLPAGLEYISITQSPFAVNTTPTIQGSTYTFAYDNTMEAGSTDTFQLTMRAIDDGNQEILVEANHPSTSGEAHPYQAGGCTSPSNNVDCSSVLVQQNAQPGECDAGVESGSYYTGMSSSEFQTLRPCTSGTFSSFDDSQQSTYQRSCNANAGVDNCTATKRYCGDATIDTADGESCDGSDLHGLSCDNTTCQLQGCTDPDAYNEDLQATQDDGSCRKMGDGIVDFSDGEACDDANTESGDGCTSDGQIESGYTCPVAGSSCQNINECDAGTDTCDVNATCTDTPGSFTCACTAGYTGDGTTCEDIDECDAGTDTCDVNASCTNTVGSHSCSCNAGYTGDGETCTDIDECALSTDACDDTGICTNTPGGYDCSCEVGYYSRPGSVSGDDNTCAEIDECTGQVETLEKSGYETIGDSPSLDQSTLCAEAGATCGNIAGGNPGFECNCPTGYALGGSGSCEVVYGDSYVVQGVEECDDGGTDDGDGCSSVGLREIPVCDITASPTTGTVGTEITVGLSGSLASWSDAVLLERGDGSIMENPVLPESTLYATGSQYMITMTLTNSLDISGATLGSCEAVVSIDTECGNSVLESGEVCDEGVSNGTMCSAEYGSTCEYCTSSCLLQEVVGPNCGDGSIDTNEGEICDDGNQNGVVCSGAGGTTCEYCSDTCEVVEYDIPVRKTGGNSSSVSVSVSTSVSTTTATKMKSSSSATQEEEVVGSDTADSLSQNQSSEKTDSSTQTASAVPSSDMSDAEDEGEHSAAPALPGLDVVFDTKTVVQLDPDSLANVLQAISSSNKDQLRDALMRYLEMKNE